MEQEIQAYYADQKNSNKNWIIFVVIIIITAIVAGMIYWYLRPHLDVDPPSGVVTAAKKELPSLLDSLIADPSALKSYGFSNQQEIKEATLGNAYRNYAILNDDISNYTSDTNFISVVKPTSWYFSVVYDNSIRVLLTIVPQGLSGWRVVGIGGNRLAVELQNVEEKWPRSSGYDKAMLEVLQLHYIFIIVSKDNKYSLYPITRFSGDSLKPELYDPVTIMQILKKDLLKK
ncbi:MAG: hypothetical protein UT33_C0008G0056 [Candidatus Peregrinibacteria bacterium GW2011_GWC2_39_14]|nr:MAG: hypothetical protein US92_C0004G0056 [Candidatus Peregrinibacteria bacterium GW2011_GWA2_38_36]KKR06740.1 MAG: hypothetical protein UT33_C0008G0056 [Candidatus Peregrinibacteria bacterium GW2011_GWC2_39_14]